MKYELDQKKFKQCLLNRGYKNVYHFASRHAIHRNTLHNLLKGKSVFANSFEKIAKILSIDPLELLVPKSPFVSTIPNLHELRPIVAKLVKKNKKMAVVLLGSRAKQTAKEYSDWDLGIFSYPEPIAGIPYLRYKRLVEDWSDNLVRQVDVVNLNQAPLWFLENLKDSAIFLDGHRESFIYLKGLIDGIQRENQAA